MRVSEGSKMFDLLFRVTQMSDTQKPKTGTLLTESKLLLSFL